RRAADFRIKLAPFAQRVAAVGVFDLDDVGAELAEKARGEGSGDQRAELEPLDAGERAFRCGGGGGAGVWDGAHVSPLGFCFCVRRGMRVIGRRLAGYAAYWPGACRVLAACLPCACRVLAVCLA